MILRVPARGQERERRARSYEIDGIASPPLACGGNLGRRCEEMHTPFQMLVMMFAGWVNEHQRTVIAYVRTQVSGINRYRVEDGRIVAEWEQMDSIGMLQQMGVVGG